MARLGGWLAVLLLAASACSGPGTLFGDEGGHSGSAGELIGAAGEAGEPLSSSGSPAAGGDQSASAGRGGTIGSDGGAAGGKAGAGGTGAVGRGGGGGKGAAGGGGKSGAGGGGKSGAGPGVGGVSGASEAGGTSEDMSGAGGAMAGAGGMGPTCPGSCDPNADCSVVGSALTCACHAGFLGDGKSCKRPISCKELHVAQPTLISGAYTLKPALAQAEFLAYCEMVAEGGGWTLVLNAGTSFDPTTQGSAGVQCYNQNCTSLAYSTVPLALDVMLDVRDGALIGNNYRARVIIEGVNALTRGKPVRTLFNGGPYYLDKEDNSNVTVRLSGIQTCSNTLPPDMASLVCDSCPVGTSCSVPVMVFGDADSSCALPGADHFAIGAAMSYTVPWTNCAGWPQHVDIGLVSYYPSNFRVWIR